MRIELNLAGINALMKSAEIKGALTDAGEAVARAAENVAASYGAKKAEFGIRTHEGDYAGLTNVYPDSREAAQANYKNNALLYAIGAAGLPTKKPRL